MKPFNAVGTLTVLTLLEGLSAFGRTSALSPFLPSLCSDLSLSMTQISGAYMLANLVAGLCLPLVGRCYDHRELSYFVFLFNLICAGSFVAISKLDVGVAGRRNEYHPVGLPKAIIGQWLMQGLARVRITEAMVLSWLLMFGFTGLVISFCGNFKIKRRIAKGFIFFTVFQFLSTIFTPTCFSGLYPLAILWIAFIGIRISVQAYALAGRSVLATHFSKRRGLATGCVQLFLTVVTASTPVVCYNISRHETWGGFFALLGSSFLIAVIIIGKGLPSKKPSQPFEAVPTGNVFGDHRALFVFIWIILFFRNAQNSGIAFHLVPMCLDFGVNPKTVSAAFMPISLLAVGMTFLFGHCFKRVGSRTVLGLFLLSDAGMLHAVKHIDADGMLGLFIACTGIYWGVNNIIASMVIPALFGVRRIGALNGFAFGAVSLGSAIGPFYFGVMKDAASYQSALTLCIGGVGLLLCLFALLQNRIQSAEAGA